MQDLNAICSQLMTLGRRRHRIIRSQRRIEQSTIQQFNGELREIENGKKRTEKQRYAHATKLYRATSKAIVEANGALDKLSDAEREICDGLSLVVGGVAEALRPIRSHRRIIEKEMETLARDLPVCDWYCSHAGCAVGGLAKIIAATGNLFNYHGNGHANPDTHVICAANQGHTTRDTQSRDAPNQGHEFADTHNSRAPDQGHAPTDTQTSGAPGVAKVWKRLGLAPVEKDGKTKACSTWAREGGLSAADWVEAGYNRQRRSDMFTIEEAIIKQSGGKYKSVFIKRKHEEIAKAEAEGLPVVTTVNATVDNWEAAGFSRPTVVKKVDPNKHRTCLHVHNRARRYMGKRLVRDLVMQWWGLE